MTALPLPVVRALKELGTDLRNARIRRRIKVEILANRCSVSRTTLCKLEHGDDSISLGVFVSILHSLGLLDRLNAFLDFRHELMMADEQLPKRIR